MSRIGSGSVWSGVAGLTFLLLSEVRMCDGGGRGAKNCFKRVDMVVSWGKGGWNVMVLLFNDMIAIVVELDGGVDEGRYCA